MFTLNNYNISAIYWNPVDFNVIGEQFSLKKTPVTFSNGMSFNLFPFLSGINDFSFNNKSGIFLTDLNNNKNILEDNSIPNDITNLTKIKTLAACFGSNFLGLYSIAPTISGLTISTNVSPSINDELIFNFEDSYVWVENYYGGVLTYLGKGEGNLAFLPKYNPLSDYQKWDYLLGDGTIMLFAYNTINTSIPVVVTKNNYDNLEANNFDKWLFTDQIPLNSILFLRSYTNKKENYPSIKDSFTVKYNPSPLLNENDLNIINTDHTYKQNYLGIFPYEHINADGKYDFYFHGLKNYQTTEYRYSTPDDYRVYNKIYSGTNQYKGLDKIHLGYQTNTVALEFPVNKETGFYFTVTSDAIPLSSCGLIEDGATAGNYPYTSDRIFTSKMGNFDEIEQLIPLINKTDTHENRFLCSWLYGNKIGGTKIWYDRYYNPAYYTIDQALSSTHLLYHDRMDTTKQYVYDVPSQTIIAPGVYYTYYHAGNQDSLDYILDLNYTYTNGLSYSNVLNITSWDSSRLNDVSPYNNYGLTFGNSGNFYGDYWSLDGSNYAIFQADDLLLQKDKFTVSLWLNVEDWSNLNGYQIFGNYYNSGFGLINDAQTVSTLMTIINNESGKIHNFNHRFGQASEINSEITNASIVQRLTDMSYWIFDSANLKAYYYSVDNALIREINITGVAHIDQVETDAKQNLYIYDNTNKIYVVYSSDGLTKKSVSTVTPLANRIEISLPDLNGNCTVFKNVYGNCSVVDNDGFLWQVIGPNVYKNIDIVATVGASNQMTCDQYNNIWIISNDNSYTKLDSNGKILFSYTFSKKPLPVQDICPIPPPPNTPLLQVLNEDLPFLATTNFVYIDTTWWQDILVTEVTEKKVMPPKPIKERIRAIDFINLPVPIKNNSDLTSICGLSAIQYDHLVMVDQTDNEAYIIDQNGNPVIKLNLEILSGDSATIKFRTGGDFTGYQNNRKYQKTKNTTISWKFKILNKTNTPILTSIKYDASSLPKGWHNFALTFDSKIGATYYIDSVPVGFIPFDRENYNNSPYTLSYDDHRTSLLLGATSIKNTILNNLINLNDGYKFIGSVADLKMYNILLNQADIEQLYYSFKFAPKIKNLNWNMPVGYRNYVEEISEWFQFQLPTNKSKYYNINIHNLDINDELKTNMELALRNIIGKLSPVHTELFKINWK
jgi:hypothetical protein